MNSFGPNDGIYLNELRMFLESCPLEWKERAVDLPSLFCSSEIRIPGVLEIVPVPLDFFRYGPDWDGPGCLFEVSLSGTDRGGRLWLYEDRWRRRPEFWISRIRTRLGLGYRLAARKCRIVVPEAAEAARFLAESHAYGNARARYRLALEDGDGLAAVATFSAPRPMQRNGVDVLSCEWVRYASRPGTVAVGGMGRLLAAFVRNFGPQEVMTYADLEWSDGEAYRQLGFRDAGFRGPVRFRLDGNGDRVSVDRLGRDRKFRDGCFPDGPVLYNRGSLKLLFRPDGRDPLFPYVP